MQFYGEIAFGTSYIYSAWNTCETLWCIESLHYFWWLHLCSLLMKNDKNMKNQIVTCTLYSILAPITTYDISSSIGLSTVASPAWPSCEFLFRHIFILSSGGQDCVWLNIIVCIPYRSPCQHAATFIQIINKLLEASYYSYTYYIRAQRKGGSHLVSYSLVTECWHLNQVPSFFRVLKLSHGYNFSHWLVSPSSYSSRRVHHPTSVSTCFCGKHFYHLPLYVYI